MKKEIVLHFVPLAAAALLGCGREPASRACVDSKGVVVNPQYCADHGGDYGSGSPRSGVYYPYYWYYYQGRVPVVIGVLSPQRGRQYAPPAAGCGGRSEAARPL